MRLPVITLALVLATGCGAKPSAPPVARVFGLDSSLPIAMPESAGPADLLRGGGARHWLLDALGGDGAGRAGSRVAVLDTLAGPDGRLALPLDAVLVLAQPRALTPQENVALDDWVRAGGRVLLFADPRLTAPSIFALGDPRRPEDIAMLSPILAHWGLSLAFDEDQPAGERTVKLPGGTPLVVDLAGTLALMRKGKGCTLASAGLLAACRIGRGMVTVVGDAALLEPAADPDDLVSRRAALTALLETLRRTS